jgi:hypothetical protein
MITFATLGPAGTNHEFVTRRYIRLHEIDDARVELVSDFKSAADGLLRGNYDFVVQCAVHPDTPCTLGSHFRKMFAVDCFISCSRELAVLTRKEVEQPKSIGLLAPATESYVNLDKWERRMSGTSLPLIFEDLLAGKIDSALVYRDYAEKHPDRVRVDEVIGSPDDVWIVYALERTSRGEIQAWKDSPVNTILRRKAAARGSASTTIG